MHKLDGRLDDVFAKDFLLTQSIDISLGGSQKGKICGTCFLSV